METRYKFEDWDCNDKSDLARLYYGNVREDKTGDLIEIPYTFYSDYSGCVVERANCDYIHDNYGQLESLAIWESYGGHGTRGYFRLVNFHSDDEDLQYLWDSLLDEINHLNNYPCLEDEYVSQLELEIEGEDWESWIKHDLSHELIKAGIYNDDTLPDDEELRKLYFIVCEESNEYWESETAISGYINIDRLVNNWESSINKYYER